MDVIIACLFLIVLDVFIVLFYEIEQDLFGEINLEDPEL